MHRRELIRSLSSFVLGLGVPGMTRHERIHALPGAPPRFDVLTCAGGLPPSALVITAAAPNASTAAVLDQLFRARDRARLLDVREGWSRAWEAEALLLEKHVRGAPGLSVVDVRLSSDVQHARARRFRLPQGAVVVVGEPQTDPRGDAVPTWFCHPVQWTVGGGPATTEFLLYEV